MRIHNTLSRKTEEFTPLNPELVSLYTCGPTVYDFAQIGNLRAYVFTDTLRRTLETSNYQVKHVMNITDVGHLASDEDEGEDKLEKGAAREQKTVWEVADYYMEAFVNDAKLLNIIEPNGYHGPHGNYARATDFIAEQLEMVRLLLDKGFAYKTEQAIYFNVAKLDDYGKLTGQNLADKEVAARAEVVTDESKQNPQDFGLWFFRVGRFAQHSMFWPSSWGDGFPGWHLECSAIIHATLGEPIDIHTGGVDHIGTHHTNEIAQTEAAYGVKLANYWVHNEHLLSNDRKMSKSAGNFFTLKDVIDKGYEPLALRLLFLQSHYRSQANFTWELLEAAAARLRSYRAMAAWRWQPVNTSNESPDIAAVEQSIKQSMQDDLNTPEALAALSKLDNRLQANPLQERHLDGFNALLKTVDSLLGLDLAQQADIDDTQKQLIRQRQTARDKDDWTTADEIRNQLKRQNLEVRDTPAGQIWSRI